MSEIPEAKDALDKTVGLLEPSHKNCKAIELSYIRTRNLGGQLVENLQLAIKGLAEYLDQVDEIGAATDKIVDAHTKAYDLLTSAGLAQHKDGNRITEDLKDLAREAGDFTNDTLNPTLQVLGREHGILHVLEGVLPIVKSSVEEFGESWPTPENFAAGISTVIQDCQAVQGGL